MISQACSPEQDEYKEEREAREGRRRHIALSPSSHSLGFSDSVSVPYPGQSKALSSSPSKQTQTGQESLWVTWEPTLHSPGRLIRLHVHGGIA